MTAAWRCAQRYLATQRIDAKPSHAILPPNTRMCWFTSSCVHCCQLELLTGWTFVHGGDAPDKGNAVGGSVRVVRTLLRLKAKYPDRVILLLGNRDINKIRLSSELAPSQLDPSRLVTTPGPFWVPLPKRVTPLMYVNAVAAAECGLPESELTEDQRQQRNTLGNRIRYILKDTMGSQGEFERRQAHTIQSHTSNPAPHRPTQHQAIPAHHNTPHHYTQKETHP